MPIKCTLSNSHTPLPSEYHGAIRPRAYKSPDASAGSEHVSFPRESDPFDPQYFIFQIEYLFNQVQITDHRLAEALRML